MDIAHPGRKIIVGPKKGDAEPPEPSPVKTYKLPPEELEKYGPVNKQNTPDSIKHITPKKIKEAFEKANTFEEAAEMLGIGMGSLRQRCQVYNLSFKSFKNKEGSEMEQLTDKAEQAEKPIMEKAREVLSKDKLEALLSEGKTVTSIAKEYDLPLWAIYELKKQYSRNQQEDKPKKETDRGIYEIFGQKVGKLVDAKQAAYGKAFQKIAKISEILYPDGVPKEKMHDFALIVRVLDKICRIADGEKSAFNESPWQDIAGYGLLGYAESTLEVKKDV